MTKNRQHDFRNHLRIILVMWVVLSFYSTVMAAATIQKIFQIDNESGEGLELRTPSSLLVQKTGVPGEFILNGELAASVLKSYNFPSGAHVEITSITNGIKIKVTGERADKITLAPSERGWVLHWPVKRPKTEEVLLDNTPIQKNTHGKEQKAKASNSKEPPPPDSLSVSMQASHFINLLRTIQPKAINITLLDQGRAAAQARKFPEAIKLFTEAARDSNLEVQAKLLLAQTYQLKGDKKKYEEAWKDYVESTKKERVRQRQDSIVTPTEFAFPKMNGLPPLELPMELKDLVVPGMEPDPEPVANKEEATAHTAEPVAAKHAEPAHTEPAHVETHEPAPVPVVQHVDTTHAQPHQSEPPKTEMAHSKPEPEKSASDTVKKPKPIQTGSFPLVPVAVTAIITLIVSLSLFMYLIKKRERELLKRMSASIPSNLTPAPKPTPAAGKLPESPKPPPPPTTIPSGMSNVASSYAANSTLSVEEQVARKVTETAVELSPEDYEDDESGGDSDSKRQMIYELEDSGMTVRDIAQKLGIGQDEVRTFLSLRKAKDE